MTPYDVDRQLVNRQARSWLQAAILVTFAWLITACGADERPKGDPLLTTQAGALSWQLWMSPDPPRQKATTLWLAVTGPGGAPMVDAELGAGYLMPAMGAMAEMRGKGEVSTAGDGQYRIDFDFPMQGTWTIDLAVEARNARAEAEYSLTTGTRGLRQVAARGSGPTAGAATPASADLAELEAHAEAFHGGDISHYTCAMHPSVKQEGPGTCPICSMTLTPVTREEVDTGMIVVDAQRRQAIGVRTAAVTVRPATVTIRTVGTVTYDETRLREVTLKNRGWIQQLMVDQTGQPVRRGQVLFTLYSPELLAAQEELLAALRSQATARSTEAPDRADYLVTASRRRLSLWDLSQAQIDGIVASGEPIQYLPVHSPASGFVVEKNVIEGAAVEPGQTLYRIAGLDKVWLDAEVYEAELPLIEIGQTAEVTFPYLSGRTFRAKVGYIYPYLQAGSRTGIVRLELPNPGLELKPDMYANIVLEAARGERVIVPEEAVIYAGPRRLVFVDRGEGRLEPRQVELGIKVADGYEVLSGLAAGDIVVTSGNFLIAAESRLKSATEHWQ